MGKVIIEVTITETMTKFDGTIIWDERYYKRFEDSNKAIEYANLVREKLINEHDSSLFGGYIDPSLRGRTFEGIGLDGSIKFSDSDFATIKYRVEPIPYYEE